MSDEDQARMRDVELAAAWLKSFRKGVRDIDQRASGNHVQRIRSSTYSPEEFAVAYTELCIDEFVASSIDKLMKLNEPYDISLALEATDISGLTKRASLVADHLTLTHAESEKVHLLRQYQGQEYEGGRTGALHVKGIGARALGDYLIAARPMLESGHLTYVPNYVREGGKWIDPDPYTTMPQLMEGADSSDISYLLLHGKRIISPRADDLAKVRLIEPILTVQIPYIEGTSMADFASIYAEESDALRALQGYFRTKLLDIDLEDPQAPVLSAKITSEISDGIRGIESELRLLNRKATVQATGAALATVTAILLAVGPAELASIAPILGLSGGAWSAALAAETLFSGRFAARNKPFYFLWLLSQKSIKAI